MELKFFCTNEQCGNMVKINFKGKLPEDPKKPPCPCCNSKME